VVVALLLSNVALVLLLVVVIAWEARVFLRARTSTDISTTLRIRSENQGDRPRSSVIDATTASSTVWWWRCCSATSPWCCCSSWSSPGRRGSSCGPGVPT
jgi:hypothetical protein